MPTSSDDVTYLAPYLGGVSRTLTNKLAEYVTPEDFGAVGNGSVDDTAALQAALNSGRDVALVSRYLVTDTVDVITRGQRIFGLTGPGTTSRASIQMAPTSTADIVMNVRAHSVNLENFVMIGRDQNESGTVVIFAEEDYLVTPDGENNGDVDLKITSCVLGRANTLIRIKGRGLNVTQCNLVSFTHGIELDWPDEQEPYADPLDPSRFNPGPNFDNKLAGGMRAYMIRDNRFHAGSGGYLVRNIGWNASRIHGIQFSGNYIDTNCRIFEGAANESLFTDNLLIHSIAPNFLFAISGGDNIRIGGNVFYGMTDNAAGTPEAGTGDTREILGGVLISDVSNVSIEGNHFKRVVRDVLSLSGTCRNILFRGNVMKDVCLSNNDTETDPTPPSRYVVRVNGPVTGLIVSENSVDNAPMARNEPLIGFATSTAAAAGLVVRDNLLPAYMDAQQPAANWNQAVGNASRQVTAYDGDGETSKTVSLTFAPAFVAVVAVTGSDRGRTMSVSTISSAGYDQVEISGKEITVKGGWNSAGISYTLHAFT
ncbi:hypothetical protein P7L66_14945 [Tistrella mobilis]|uniref:hypothetical protein n=1 Tax=Tistrella mobilis TaxID=171437 RepID=UPI003555F4A6